MTDFANALRQAAENEAARTVTPPFARIEHRRARRRTGHAALAGAAVVAAGGIAVAAPGLGGGGTTPLSPVAPSGRAKYHHDLPNDPAAVEAVRACITRRDMPVPPRGLPYLDAPYQLMFEPGYAEVYDVCLRESGYQEFAVEITPQLRERDRSDDACVRATADDTIPFHRGQGVTGEWRLRVGFDGNMICLLVKYDRRELPSRGNEERRLPVQRDDRFQYHRTAPEVLLYGWRDPRVARVEILVDGRTYEEYLSGPADGPALFYAMTVPLPRGTALVYTVRAYDSDGRPVGQTNVIQAGPAH